MKNNPSAFKRSIAMVSAIRAIAYNNTPLVAQTLIGQLKPYKSRGHGRGLRSGSRVKIHNKMLRHHNVAAFCGARECARRAKKIRRDEGKTTHNDDL